MEVCTCITVYIRFAALIPFAVTFFFIYMSLLMYAANKLHTSLINLVVRVQQVNNPQVYFVFLLPV